MLEPSNKVVIAMSGGVDSSVAAALLVEQGYEVTGMMLRLWSECGREADNRCCTPDSMAIARQVAARLDIPFYVVDAQEAHYDAVVRTFIDGYQAGYTPNPCLACNNHIRWGFLLQHARLLGANWMATGHYARLDRQDKKVRLLVAKDSTKDQSYVLHSLTQNRLSQTLFPLGDLTKIQVRQIARERGLPAAERSESQDLCFLGGEDYRNFLLRVAPQTYKPGPILTQDDRHLGSHRGLAFYTIGQRKGIGISSPAPLYVLQKDLDRNALIVGSHEALGSGHLVAGGLSWVAGSPPASPFQADVKIRSTAARVGAVVNFEPNQQAFIQLNEPLRDITPGQAAVFYQGEICLGGGIIIR